MRLGGMEDVTYTDEEHEKIRKKLALKVEAELWRVRGMENESWCLKSDGFIEERWHEYNARIREIDRE
jgi:hypothetical protein